ncbi:hypothetical protein QYM36_013027 [Artemia franciscana]|uniref:Arf-GAP domain-containing protein n=1 Tax=Artemia franciscana TaxID=6661 RepID=A0AA88HLF1_ARTSF|nr:hypothetical protein QYM36_013027 [Artemia franciscana]
MASKKKVDDKHLEALRSLASLAPNKNCFDCGQKGTTYINMTIGSFVCVSCSGKLRGLNPPHRVKSISMAKFTEEEIGFLKARGNEFCQRVWMGKSNQTDSLEEGDKTQNMERHLIMKYENKKWYVDLPRSLESETCLPPTPNVLGSATLRNKEIQPLPKISAPKSKSLTNQLTPSLSQLEIAAKQLRPGASLTRSGIQIPIPAEKQQNEFSQPSFANFSSFCEGHSAWEESSLRTEEKTSSSKEDKYAALKDLDLIFSSSNNNIAVEEKKNLNDSTLSTMNRFSWGGSTSVLSGFNDSAFSTSSGRSLGSSGDHWVPLHSSSSTSQLWGEPRPLNPFFGKLIFLLI